MSSRRFGVEIEHGFPGGREAVRALMLKEFPKFARDIGQDGSGVELRTPVLRGEAGFAALKKCMDLLKENGGYVSRADGMHVHHEALDYKVDPPAIGRLVEAWAANQDAIDQLVDANRRRNGCTPKTWTKDKIKQLKDSITENPLTLNTSGVRGCLNLSPINSGNNTIEIRQHEGTLDFEVAEAWIKFCQAFLDNVIAGRPAMKISKVKAIRRVRKFKTCKGLVNYLELPANVRERLEAKAKAERDAGGKSRMLSITEARAQLVRDGGLPSAIANDAAMGPLP